MQKADREAGIEPREIPIKAAFCNGDCGEDLRGLGCGAYCTDVPLDRDIDEDEEAIMTLPA
eukprot:1901177-Pyramimonas_sp.AAC.1